MRPCHDAGEECVELPLIVTRWQYSGLEKVANRKGLTIG